MRKERREYTSDTAHPGLLGLLSDMELVLTGTVHGLWDGGTMF